MEPPPKPSQASTSLFQVYLRLRPPVISATATSTSSQSLYPALLSATTTTERYLTVEEAQSEDGMPTHITITPPMESRRRAVEKFAFTKVFEEDATQLDIFKGTGVVPLIEGVVGKEARDGLVATLGVTGSGKSHTILGSKSQRGLTQLSLDVTFNSLRSRLLHPSANLGLCSSLTVHDVSEAQLLPANVYLDSLYGEGDTGLHSRASSRAPTPMTMVGNEAHPPSPAGDPTHMLRGLSIQDSPWIGDHNGRVGGLFVPVLPSSRILRSVAKSRFPVLKDGTPMPTPSRRRQPPRISGMPQLPDVDHIELPCDERCEYAIVISMYEVYNDRIFDLLTPQASSYSAQAKAAGQQKDRRRALLFKSTEKSPDRKVVAGLRKIICGDLNEALMVLETGLYERRVAGTGSNSVSSRSHGFFCVEVKRKRKGSNGGWSGSALTIVDLAGSERARNANTAGATLAEAGKINESLMYLGQCLQLQSDNNLSTKPALVPFRQCKLTELLFSNSFPSASTTAVISHLHTNSAAQKNPQKAVMIVTADPLGDFNATSQILRYSALAREITVPRIPSVTSTILSGTTANNKGSFSGSSGRTTPNAVSAEELEYAAQEIARLMEEVDLLNFRLSDEEERRREAEHAWQGAEERAALVDQEAREECWREMEARIEEEKTRWRVAWEEEKGRGQEVVDRKVEILTRSAGVGVWEDPEPEPAARVQELEEENEVLRRKLEMLEREVGNRSPTRKSRIRDGSAKVLMPETEIVAIDDSDEENRVMGSLAGLKLSASTAAGGGEGKATKSPVKRQRKLTTRKWNGAVVEGSP